MKDFDAKRLERRAERERLLSDRSFVIGGETFTHVATISSDLLKRLATPRYDLDGGAFIESVEDNVLDLIEGGKNDHKRFMALLKRKEDPITFEDLQILCNDIQEAIFQRPTEASLPSSDGDASTGTTLTENSSTEPAVASAA